MSTMILSEEFNKKQSEEEFGIQRNKNYKTMLITNNFSWSDPW